MNQPQSDAMPDIQQKARVMRVAAVQMESKDGLIEANLQRAMSLIEQAARDGAQLILLPEFMPTGYRLTKDIWDIAEPKEGLTIKWLRNNSRRLSVWLGTSFLEADGEDFFNTFALATPDGEVAGRVRKQFPAIWEAYFLKGDAGSHVIHTEIGKIGIGICHDSHLAYIAQLMYEQSVDLMLMPHSYPMPAKPSKTVSEQDIERSKGNLREMAPLYARLLGVPALVANKCGPWQPDVPWPPLPKTNGYHFPGLSTIADSDSSVKARLGDDEGVLVAEVTLGSSRKTRPKPQRYGRWVYPGPPGRDILRIVEVVAGLSYALNSERKKKGREVSS